MSEEQKFILESISALVKSGFWDTEEIEEFIAEEIQVNELQRQVSEKWVKETIEKEQRILLKASKNWHVPTTTQKLIKAFDQLIEQNITALHYAGYSADDAYYEIDQIEALLLDKDKRSTGVCFYHEQDLQRAFRDIEPVLRLSFHDLHSEKDEDSIAVGKTIVATLNKNGLQTDWDQTATQKITILNFPWQQVYKPENNIILDYDAVADKLLQNK
ncbi:hypothetical protein AV926_15990 [Myroides marinus]|uniref:DUF6891 domain-containing protein n=1 Tax=Myroides marinus TaxID=703342 RepID=A0A163WG34_9FLAO|nr:hypothetical protein [Myroides marinus]KZE76307.1 hypothetical protein AV926_15990 [Myroides marinus]